MDKSLNRTVVAAKFHEGMFIAGAGEIGKVLPATEKTIMDLRMTTTVLGLLVSGVRNSIKFEALAPWANVAQVTLVPGEETNVEKNSTSNKTK